MSMSLPLLLPACFHLVAYLVGRVLPLLFSLRRGEVSEQALRNEITAPEQV